MRKLVLTLASVIFYMAFAEPLPKFNTEIGDLGELPGINFGFSNLFFNNFLHGFLPELFKQLNYVVFKDRTVKFKVSDLFDVYLRMFDASIPDTYYDINGTNVVLISANNTVGIHVLNSGVHLNTSYDLFLDPKILQDRGTVIGGYDNLTLNFVFGMKARPDDPRRFEVIISEANLDVKLRNIHLNLTNQNEFIKMFSNILTLIKPKIHSWPNMLNFED